MGGELPCRYLLPPIIFYAGLSVKKKQFFRNFVSIASFGILGTYIAFAVIAFVLYGFSKLPNILTLPVSSHSYLVHQPPVLLLAELIQTLPCEKYKEKLSRLSRHPSDLLLVTVWIHGVLGQQMEFTTEAYSKGKVNDQSALRLGDFAGLPGFGSDFCCDGQCGSVASAETGQNASALLLGLRRRRHQRCHFCGPPTSCAGKTCINAFTQTLLESPSPLSNSQSFT